nr:hypothetical protein Itr_chr13CG18350 [Ipomoea trifida]
MHGPQGVGGKTNAAGSTAGEAWRGGGNGGVETTDFPSFSESLSKIKAVASTVNRNEEFCFSDLIAPHPPTTSYASTSSDLLPRTPVSSSFIFFITP